MRYIKLLRIPIALLIVLSHGINPFKKLKDIIPMIRLHLSDWEKEYIINTCLSTDASEDMRKLIYE